MPAQTITQTVNWTLSPAARIVNVPSQVSLIKAGSAFRSFAGQMTIQFLARTGNTGPATLTLHASDFAPAGGPALVSQPLTYTCSGATAPAVGCSGAQVVSTTDTAVAIFPGDTGCTGCGDASPLKVSIAFDLVNVPRYRTGIYSATITFTITAP